MSCSTSIRTMLRVRVGCKLCACSARLNARCERFNESGVERFAAQEVTDVA